MISAIASFLGSLRSANAKLNDEIAKQSDTIEKLRSDLIKAGLQKRMLRWKIEQDKHLVAYAISRKASLAKNKAKHKARMDAFYQEMAHTYCDVPPAGFGK